PTPRRNARPPLVRLELTRAVGRDWARRGRGADVGHDRHMAAEDLCPCGSGNPLERCCGPIVGGDKPAPTAERLMRSRFTAFALADDAPWARRTSDGWSLTIRVQPGAVRSEVVGPHGDALRIRIASPPVDGKANAELVRFLAEHLGLPARSVEVVRGQTSRTKVVRVVSG
ncbi:MAG: DUF167 family protein, partial [Acidimicrobiales bacterium]